MVPLMENKRGVDGSVPNLNRRMLETMILIDAKYWAVIQSQYIFCYAF